MKGFPEAWVFDLDGTLVQTETLKADSYHAALARVIPAIPAAEVHAHYATVVGRSGEEVARSMVERFTTPEQVRARLQPESDEAAWVTLYRVRKVAYASLVDDAEAIRRVGCPFNRALLQVIRQEGGRVALATMSHRPQVRRVLDVLDLADAFELVATRDDVSRGKPDPEIYHAVFDTLGVQARETAIVEDSPSGARAAVASGAHVLVVVNNVTRQAVARADLGVPIFESDGELVPAVRRWRATAAR